MTKQEVIRQDIEKAKKSGAERCAPKELALAEANADFASHDMPVAVDARTLAFTSRDVIEGAKLMRALIALGASR